MERMERARALRLGANLGRIAHVVARRPRFYAHRNLRLVPFGRTMSERERAAFVRQVFVEFGKSAADFVRAAGRDPAETLALVRAVDGWEHVQPARERGKGLILLGAHIGNWELQGRWVVAQGIPMTVVARDPEDAAFGAHIRQLRENAGLGVLSRGSSARDLLKVLRRGEAIGLLPDQNRGDVFAPFFDVPCGTPAGPATLSLHTGAPLLAGYCVREPDDTYRMICLPPLSVEKTGDMEADTARIMTEANRALESVVRRYPTQWLWLHNRWRGIFDAQNIARRPPGYDYAELERLWQGRA